MMDSVSIDSKLTYLKIRIDATNIGSIHAEGFKILMVDHVSARSWLGTLFIVCFIITGFPAVLTTIICQRNYFLARGWIGKQKHPPHHPREYTVDHHNRDFSENEEEELSRIIANITEQSRNTKQ
jgi:hypothetical protein